MRMPSGTFPFFALLYFALFAAYGTESPFFPSFLVSRGLTPNEVATVLAAGTVMRLSTGPVWGMIADRRGTRGVLALAAIGSGTVIFLYLAGRSFPTLLAVSMAHAVMIAPLNALADALCVADSARPGGVTYGRVRGIGSAGFVAGTIVSGFLVAAYGLDSILIGAGILFLAAAAPVRWLPPSVASKGVASGEGMRALFAGAPFRRVLLVAALVIGSHAMSDAFAVIHWRSIGIGSTTAGLLWSEAVLAEIVVFALVGPRVLRRFGPSLCAVAAAVAGMVRWSVLALTDNLVALAATQSLHGLTFALLHLACMHVIRTSVTERQLAKAQTLYGTLSLGIASAVLTLMSGKLYGAIGTRGFAVMAALCALALPFAWNLDHAPRATGAVPR